MILLRLLTFCPDINVKCLSNKTSLLPCQQPFDCPYQEWRYRCNHPDQTMLCHQYPILKSNTDNLDSLDFCFTITNNQHCSNINNKWILLVCQPACEIFHNRNRLCDSVYQQLLSEIAISNLTAENHQDLNNQVERSGPKSSLSILRPSVPASRDWVQIFQQMTKRQLSERTKHQRHANHQNISRIL